MIVEILLGALLAIVILAVVLRTIIGEENRIPVWTRLQMLRKMTARRPPPPVKKVVTKDMIIAMAQREVYKLKNCARSAKAVVGDKQKGKEEQWARQMITRMCARLDRDQPNVALLSGTANSFCDWIEKTIDDYKKNLSEIEAMLVLINRQRLVIEQQLSITKLCAPGETETAADECFMMVFDQITNNAV